MKKRIIIASYILIIIGINKCIAQSALVNNGDIISNLNGNILYVNGDITNLTNGQFENHGSIYLTEDWTNNGGNAAFMATSQGAVLMTGANQFIQGTNVTDFYTLTLLGSGIKQLNNIDAIVKDSLNLNDRELSTNTNSVSVTNTNSGIVTRTNGFVSSLGNGALIRNTAAAVPYLFPVGSSISPTRYRPVEINPTSNLANTFAVRMANTDATSEGFNRNQKETYIGSVNPLYYHRIRRDSGSDAADVTVYYDALLDGSFTGMGHWQNIPQWEDMIAASDVSNYGLSAMSKKQWNDFSLDAFALITNECGNLFVPNGFSPNGDGSNDVFDIKINEQCVTEYNLLIFDRLGEKVFQSNDINKKWDGNYKGVQLDDAVFVYILSVNLMNQPETIIKKGNVSILK